MEKIRDVVCKNFNRLVDAYSGSKKSIAQQMGISESTLQRWKKGENTPELPNIEALAKILNVDPMEFYREESGKIRNIKSIKTMISSVPDSIYDLAAELDDSSDSVWEEVAESLLIAIEQKRIENRA